MSYAIVRNEKLNSIIMCQMVFTSDQTFLIKLEKKKQKDILMNVIGLFVIIKILEKRI